MKQRLGNRGLILLIFGFIWVVTAWTVAQAPIPNTRPPAPHEEIPPWIREAAWVITGLVAMASAFVRQGRDKWGFGALVIMPAERALSWLFAMILHYTSPIPYPPLALSAGQFLIFAATVVAIVVIGRWKESSTFVVVPLDGLSGDELGADE